MYKVGLCSVTFRNLSVEDIINVSTQAGLAGIEWGGDVHVPPGDISHAQKVATLTEQAGLEVVSYGSYYRVGDRKNDEATFETILETAIALKASAIRVWAGTLGSEEADDIYRNQVVEDAKRIGSLAEQKGVSIHFEYHGNTLTDTKESAVQLMKEVDRPNVYIYWQPAVGLPVEDRLESIRGIRPWLSHVHVFHWEITDRLPFKTGLEEWRTYLQALKEDHKNRYLFMEFVKDDSVDQFLEDASRLKEIVKDLES